MTREDLDRLLNIWIGRLGLNDWLIYLVIDKCEDEISYMEVELSDMYERALIHVNPWIVGEEKIPNGVLMRDVLTDDFIESSLVHELLHLHTRNLRAIVKNDLYGVVSRDLYNQLNKTMDRTDEQVVDKLAVALVKAFKG